MMMGRWILKIYRLSVWISVVMLYENRLVLIRNVIWFFGSLSVVLMISGMVMVLVYMMRMCCRLSVISLLVGSILLYGWIVFDCICFIL